MKSLRYPDMRANLHAFSQSLSDEAYQKKVWVDCERPASRDSFSDVVHFFYDDTTLAEHPDQWIGLILRDAAEVEAVRALTSAIDGIFAKLGTEETDEVYVHAPDWPQVVQSARELVTQLERPDEPAVTIRRMSA